MIQDGPSVPKTLPSTKQPPPIDPWFDASKTITERATALLGLHNARGRAGVLQTLVYELNRRETDTTTTVADLFEAAFKDRSGAAFWRARLSLMTDRGEFIAMLLPHLTAENGNDSLNRLKLGDLVSRDLPASGLLREDRFDPLSVVKWIGEREGYWDMLPASLHAFLKPSAGESFGRLEASAAATPRAKRGPGRPGPSQLIRNEWLARQSRGETLNVNADEARALLAWFAREYPKSEPAALRTIQNHLSDSFATLKVQVKGS